MAELKNDENASIEKEVVEDGYVKQTFCLGLGDDAFEITVRESDGYINVSKMVKMYGKMYGKQIKMSYCLNNARFKEEMAELQKLYPQKELLEKPIGRGNINLRGRYAHRSIAYAVASWMSVKLRVKVFKMLELEDEELRRKKDEECESMRLQRDQWQIETEQWRKEANTTRSKFAAIIGVDDDKKDDDNDDLEVAKEKRKSVIEKTTITLSEIAANIERNNEEQRALLKRAEKQRKKASKKQKKMLSHLKILIKERPEAKAKTKAKEYEFIVASVDENNWTGSVRAYRICRSQQQYVKQTLKLWKEQEDFVRIIFRAKICENMHLIQEFRTRLNEPEWENKAGCQFTTKDNDQTILALIDSLIAEKKFVNGIDYLIL